MPTGRGWAALGVSSALFALWLGFGEIELMATGMFLVAAVAVGVLFTWSTHPDMDVSRRIYPAQVHENEDVVVEVDVTSTRPIRNLFVDDTVHDLGTARFAAGRAERGQRLVARYEVTCRSRGVYPVGPAEVTVGDPLGLAERRTIHGRVDRLTVYPRVETLAGFPPIRGIDPTVQSSRPTHAPFGGEDFFTLREYQVGDDLRKVHWPSSAKRDVLMIKQLEVPWQARALVLIDTRAGRFPHAEAFEQAVRGAASAMTHLHRGGFAPELWSTERSPGSRASDRYRQAMETLATIRTTTRTDLRHTLARLRRHGVGGGALILVTGTPDESTLGAHRVLAPEFTRTIVMVVADRPGDAAAAFRRAGAVTVSVTTAGTWAPAWRTAMELSWSTASAG